jgi:hypothetical protein
VATVIGTAVVPTVIANAWFMPRHLLPKPVLAPEEDVEMLEEDLREMP